MISDDEIGDYLEQELAAAPRELTPSLYHYTTSDAAILGILATRTIRISPFAGTNDLWESRPLRPSLEGALPRDERAQDDVLGIWEDVDRYIRGHSKVACFTQDWALPESVMQPDALRGWSHLSLWAHYGANHTGVCLRFDRDLLVAAFEAAKGNAVHQFYGPVRYRGAEIGVGPRGISLEQAAEFGLDAVALQYAHVNRDRVFFRKHVDWASESEFRLVRTDLSTEPHYVNIAEALTGVVLGDAFPNDRAPALLTMLAGFDNVEVLQARFANRTLQVFPWERQAEPEPARTTIPVTTSTIRPRRTGNLTQRLSLLEESERIADSDREVSMQAAAPILQMWHEGLAARPEVYSNWSDVVMSVYPQTGAIPTEDRRKRPGVSGEVISYEAGLMVVAENQPQYSFTWVMGIALQLMQNGAARLHACISMEEWRSGGNNQQDLYRDRRDTTSDDVMEMSIQVLASLIDAVPVARSQFDALRGTQ